MAEAAAARVTYAEYLDLEASSEQRYEFVDGAVHAMAGGTPEHARLMASMTIALGAALADKPCAVYSSDLKIRIDATKRTTYADVVVVCGPEIHSDIDPNAIINPSVIVEVLSPATEASDRVKSGATISSSRPCASMCWSRKIRPASRSFGATATSGCCVR